MKIWYLACLYIFYYSIALLIDERYEVTYVFEENNEYVLYQNHSICIPFEYFSKNQVHDKLNYNQKLFNRSKLSFEQLRLLFFYNMERLNKSKFSHPTWERLYFKILSKILNEINSANSIYFYNYHYCLTLNFWLANEIFFSIGNLEMKYFSFENSASIFFFNANDRIVADKLIIKNMEPPYSNCLSNNGKYSKFDCVNKCLINQIRSMKFYYNKNESDLIDLKDDKQLRLKYQKKCYNKCEESCELKFYGLSNGIGSIKLLRSYPMMNEISFWIQLLGLISLLTNFSIYGRSKILIRIIFKLILKKKFYKEILIKLSTLILSLTLISFFYYELISNYKQIQRTPRKQEILSPLLESENITLVFCLNVDQILKNNLKQNFYTNNEDKPYYNKSLSKLEQLTDNALNQTIKKIYLNVEGRKTKINYELSSKVLFLNTYYKLNRCFQLEINPIESKYQSLLRISKLSIELNYNYFDLFLLFNKSPFTSFTRGINEYFNFNKKIIKRSKLKDGCIDYEDLNLNCKNKYQCIDQCQNYEYAKKNKSIINRSVIDKSFFTDYEWSNYFFKTNLSYFSSEYCRGLYTKPDCTEVTFENKDFIAHDYEMGKINLDLHYQVIKIIDIDPSIRKLFFDMITVQSFVIGLNVLKIFSIILSLSNMNLNKIKSYSILLVCLMGFLVHLYFLLNEILYGELINSEFYENLDQVDVPEIVLCFPIQERLIDSNRKLTGKYLNGLVKDIKFKKVFKSIKYLNNTNDWIEINSNNHKNQTFNQLKIDQFLFLNKKCFTISIKIEYYQYQFLYETNTDVLKIDFNQNFIEKNPNMTFFLRKPKTMSFSRITNFFSLLDRSYTIKEEVLEIIYNDKFNLLKYPLSLFKSDNDNVNDVNLFIKKIIGSFKANFNLSTINLPLKKLNYHLHIDDEIFNQFNLDLQNILDKNKYKNKNFKNIFIIKHIKQLFKFYYKFNENDHFNLKFDLLFYKKIILITNRESYPKLFLTFLNLLSFWLDLGVLDLGDHIYRLKFIFISIHNLLIKIDIYLNRKI